MLLKSHHKRAARYLLVGMSALDVARHLPPFTVKQIKEWRTDLEFKMYMARLERHYLELLDRDIEHVRRAATVRLQEIIETPYHSPHFNMVHFEWAVNKIFQVSGEKERNKAAAGQYESSEGHAAISPEQKEALKQLIRVSPDPTRYVSGKQGEA
jgi:hypothetical protein